MHHDDKGPLATKEVDQQLEKGVDGKGLLAISPINLYRRRTS